MKGGKKGEATRAKGAQAKVLLHKAMGAGALGVNAYKGKKDKGRGKGR